MTQTTKPTKEAVRAYMQRPADTPPPSLEEIRRQLGWYLNPANNKENAE